MIIYQCPDRGFYPLSFDIAHNTEDPEAIRITITYISKELKQYSLRQDLSAYSGHNLIYIGPV